MVLINKKIQIRTRRKIVQKATKKNSPARKNSTISLRLPTKTTTKIEASPVSRINSKRVAATMTRIATTKAVTDLTRIKIKTRIVSERRKRATIKT